MRSTLVMFGAALVLGACSDATAPPRPPVMILLDSLRSVNDTAIPCCGATAGALTFYAPVHFDTASSPGGPAQAGCVTEVPDGELIDPRHGVATSADSVTIPFFSCETGSYRITIQATGSAGGGPKLVQAGYFGWTPDSLWHSGTLTLIDTIGGLYWSVKVTGPTFQVPFFGIPHGSYGFQVTGGGE